MAPAHDDDEEAVRSGRRRRWRAVRRIALAMIALVAIAFGLLFAAVELPVQDEPRAADVIVVLGGLGSRAVIKEAERLADEGYADRILISDAFGKDTLPQHLCADFPERFECFEAEPGTTQGEARRIEEIAAERGWDEVLVVTRTYHITRARLLIGRCYSGGLAMIGVDGDRRVGDRAYQLAYQAGAFVKAAVSPAC